MTNKEKEIRDKVRKELLKAKEKDFKEYSSKYWWYVSDLKDNLIDGYMPVNHKKMFRNGSGSELDDKVTPAKAKAIDSSSMLAYNFFRHIGKECPVEIEGIKYNKAYFEVQLRTLNTRGNPANMDVVLVSEDNKTVLFIESKFLEYLESSSEELSPSYTTNDAFYYVDSEKDSLLKMAQGFTNKRGHYNYGIKQNICHLIGISNLKCSKDAREWFKKKYGDSREICQILEAEEYRFINIIFRPKNDEALELCNKYIKDLVEFGGSLLEAIKKYTEPKFIMDYSELYKILLSSNLDESVKMELKKRYIDFHTDQPL